MSALQPGLFSVAFKSSGNLIGSGVAFFDGGKVYGGDAGFYYVGNYQDTGEGFYCQIKVRHHHGPALSIFGQAKEFDLELSGHSTGNGFEATGHVTGHPNLRIGIHGSLLCMPIS